MKLSKPSPHPYKYSPWLVLLVVLTLLVPNVWLSITEQLTTIQAITNVVLPGGIYLLLMCITPRVGRATLWMTILMIFAAFQMVLLYMYGRSVIAVDMYLNIVTTNPGEVTELLGNIVVIIAVVICLYIPPIVFGIIAVLRRWRLSPEELRGGRIVSGVIIFIGVIFFVLSFFGQRRYAVLRDIYPLNVFYNMGVAVNRATDLTHYHETSADYRYDAVSTVPDSVNQVIVLVIGETSRADNWQLLGYERPTTPRLMNRKGLTSFAKALSQANTTHKSVPMLLSPLDATTFSDSINHVKSLVTAFKEAGFHTAYFSNQNRNHSYIDFFAEEADTTVFLSDAKKVFESKSFDTELLPLLDEKLAQNHSKLLVILHCYGSHFNYIDRYPKGFGSFKPDGPAKATHHYRNEQINAYDNTIELTSGFIADIIDHIEATGKQASMLFTSDHGEDIFDDERRLFLHCSPIPSFYQIHVPVLVWLSDNYVDANPQVADVLKANSDKFVASTSTFFHTAMNLAGIESPKLDVNKSLISPTYTPDAAIVLNDHNEAIPLIECGLLKYDFDELRKKGFIE
ncbi:MAG: lipid A phosphoethanolamine transferase [Paramuribaculum sp.]|nr:lipid A phosphoethanolamine transferase [Paramuribaculum sp.]